MFNLLESHFEADLARTGAQNAALARRYQYRNKLLWFLCFSAALVATLPLAMLLAAHTVKRWEVAAALLMACSLAATTIFIRVSDAVDVKRSDKLLYQSRRLKLKLQSDVLLLPGILSLFFVLAPAFLATMIAYFGPGKWAPPGSDNYIRNMDALKQLATLAGALLAIQVAIFNFLFGQILGKFSSFLAVAISHHFTVRVLRNYSLVLICVVYSGYFLGVPESLHLIGPLIVASLVAAFTLTIWISNRGVRLDRALIYCGEYGANRILRYSWTYSNRFAPFWRGAANLGLDWRDPDRLLKTQMPGKLVDAAVTPLVALLNAANKSIQDNQIETLNASLAGLTRVMDAYVLARAKFMGSQDNGIGFVNDQFAALIGVASKASNEYLISSVVRAAGSVSRAVLTVGHDPGKLRITKTSSRSFTNWAVLFEEAFEYGRKLKRSTAATEAIRQVCELCKTAIKLGYVDDIQYSAFRVASNIQRACISSPDFYHLSLLGELNSGMMSVWYEAAGDVENLVLTKPFVEFFELLLKSYGLLSKTGACDLGDPVTGFTSKLNEVGHPIQDVALRYCTNTSGIEDTPRVISKSLLHILGLLVRLIDHNMDLRTFFVTNFAFSYYEILMLIELGAPALGGKDGDSFKAVQREDALQKIPQLLRKSWLLEHSRSEVDASLVGIIGIFVASAKLNGDEALKLQIGGVIEALASDLAAREEGGEEESRVSEIQWSCLQQLGAWVAVIGLEDTAEKIVGMIARDRRDRSMWGYGGRWTSMGYMDDGIMSGDYALPFPRNIKANLTEAGWKSLESWNAVINADDVLGGFHTRIRERRATLQTRSEN